MPYPRFLGEHMRVWCPENNRIKQAPQLTKLVHAEFPAIELTLAYAVSFRMGRR